MAAASSTLDEATRALLRLSLTPGLGPKLTTSLLERFGSAPAILAAPAAELQEVPYLGSKVAAQLVQAWREPDEKFNREIEQVEQLGITLLGRGQPGYPAVLLELADPPTVLYQRGTLEPRDLHALAIVGSRQCTAYGRRVTAQLAGSLARRGFTIISGLARGIDGVAHQAALDAGGRTLAVLAGGLAKIYPPEHADLATAIAAAGALLSESPLGMAPLPDMFPRRNRLISGLALGVIVVEAHAKSGALITARHAAEQGRDVFAVPGPVDSDASAGPLQLLRDGAILVRHADDVLESISTRRLPGLADAGAQAADPLPPPVPVELPASTPPDQRQLWDALTQPRLHLDELIQATGLDPAAASSALMMLELGGLVRRLPGNRFERQTR
ncbi:MAG TPA: DNA-processing protein DprA [Gemmatales bacterium]|nr:DNA-processing protein DprA [Gemmatales bacterium]HMP58053.1 DNA-processing protein DprA [Gemmatales bacterium]